MSESGPNQGQRSKYWWLVFVPFLLLGAWAKFSESSWFSRIAPNRISVDRNQLSIVLPPKWTTLSLNAGRNITLMPMNSGKTYKAWGGNLEVISGASIRDVPAAIRTMAKQESCTISEESTVKIRGMPAYHCTYLSQRNGKKLISELWAVQGFNDTVYSLTLSAEVDNYEKCKAVFQECAESMELHN